MENFDYQICQEYNIYDIYIRGRGCFDFNCFIFSGLKFKLSFIALNLPLPAKNVLLHILCKG